MPKQPQAAPAYSIGDIVYLRGSASIGFLEGYKITGINRFDRLRNQWKYEIGLNYNITGAPITIGDNITLKGGTHEDKVLYFIESELIDFCEAANTVKTVLEQRLLRIEALIAAQCGGSG